MIKALEIIMVNLGSMIDISKFSQKNDIFLFK